MEAKNAASHIHIIFCVSNPAFRAQALAFLASKDFIFHRR